MTKCKDCKKIASFAKPDEIARYCATHKKQGMINVTKKICNQPDCKKQAISGYFKCIKHGGGKRCNEPGCGEGARGNTDKCSKHGGGKRCNEPGCGEGAQGNTDKCKKHGGGKRCNEPDCGKSALGNTDKCSKHGGGKRCNEPGCGEGAVGKTDKCSKHGGGKRCNEPDCGESARNKSDKCIKHGGGKRCNEPGCGEGARGKTDKCSKHKGGKRCNEPGCGEGAQGNTDKCIKHGGGKRCNEAGCESKARDNTGKCKKHGGGKRCPNCIDWIDSRCGSNKYDGYCATCFKQVFPDDERSKVVYSHTKEILVRNAINDKFDGFIHDKPLYTGNCDCTHRRRIDHRKMIGNTILAVETDEFGHRAYDEKDEIIRYDDLYMIHSGKWIFIRFNPDGDKKIDMEDKLEKLIDTIEEQVGRIENEENENLLEIIKLY